MRFIHLHIKNWCIFERDFSSHLLVFVSLISWKTFKGYVFIGGDEKRTKKHKINELSTGKKTEDHKNVVENGRKRSAINAIVKETNLEFCDWQIFILLQNFFQLLYVLLKTYVTCNILVYFILTHAIHNSPLHALQNCAQVEINHTIWKWTKDLNLHFFNVSSLNCEMLIATNFFCE